MSTNQSTGLRAFLNESLAIGVIAVCATVAFLLVDVRTALVKHNDLTSQQIAVTRSMHYVQELATAYMEKRKASEAAEESFTTPLNQDEDQEPRR